jgi:hypothetical protein
MFSIENYNLVPDLFEDIEIRLTYNDFEDSIYISLYEYAENCVLLSITDSDNFINIEKEFKCHHEALLYAYKKQKAYFKEHGKAIMRYSGEVKTAIYINADKSHLLEMLKF